MWHQAILPRLAVPSVASPCKTSPGALAWWTAPGCRQARPPRRPVPFAAACGGRTQRPTPHSLGCVPRWCLGWHPRTPGSHWKRPLGERKSGLPSWRACTTPRQPAGRGPQRGNQSITAAASKLRGSMPAPRRGGKQRVHASRRTVVGAREIVDGIRGSRSTSPKSPAASEVAPRRCPAARPCRGRGCSARVAAREDRTQPPPHRP